MGVASRGGMNVVTFQVKRAHWRLWDLAAGVLSFFGTTPARLDMLQAIDRHGAPTQSYLRTRLGLSAPTVSKMVKLLRERGFVRCEENPDDGRSHLVVLTQLARDLLERVSRVVVRSGIASLAAVRSLVDDRRRPERTDSLIQRTKEVQRALEDRAHFVPEIPTEMPDLGASLEGDDRKLYDAIVDYCRSRFYHLPIAYLLEL